MTTLIQPTSWGGSDSLLTLVSEVAGDWRFHCGWKKGIACNKEPKLGVVKGGEVEN